MKQPKCILKVRLLAPVILCATILSSQAWAGGESGGGGDKVEPLFIQAQQQVINLLSAIDGQQIDQVAIPATYRTWLKQTNRLSQLQFYATNLLLKFQDGPCIEGESPRGASFDNTDPASPKMCVSYSYNQNTTPEQAKALVIHEAGHFTGEMNHVFLSGLGTELVAHPYHRYETAIRVSDSIKNPDNTVTFLSPVYLHPQRGSCLIGTGNGFVETAYMAPEWREYYRKVAKLAADAVCKAAQYRASTNMITKSYYNSWSPKQLTWLKNNGAFDRADKVVEFEYFEQITCQP